MIPHVSAEPEVVTAFELAFPLLVASIVAVALVLTLLLVLTGLNRGPRRLAETGTARQITKENTDG